MSHAPVHPQPPINGFHIGPAFIHFYGLAASATTSTRELFGGPTSLPWGLEIAPAFRPAGYARYPAFHPTFLYELVFDLALAGVLVWLGHHRRIRPPGLFALYVAGYSAFRIFEESLRVDPSEHFLGLRLNMYVASALMLAGAIGFGRTQRRRPPVAAAAASDSEPADTAGSG